MTDQPKKNLSWEEVAGHLKREMEQLHCGECLDSLREARAIFEELKRVGTFHISAIEIFTYPSIYPDGEDGGDGEKIEERIDAWLKNC